jgi:predicted neuraminidase
MTINRSIDTLILGGGMAGAFAALAAKTSTNTVAIVEPSNVLGGQGTAGGVAGFCGDSQRVNAPFSHLVATLTQHDLIAAYDPLADRRAYDLELCAFFLQEMVAEAGVEILFHARALDAHAQDGRITGVEVACASDRIAFQPGMVVDATGDCAVAHAAGFETMHEGANQQLPMSLYFTLWDTGRPVAPFLPPGCPTWEDDEALPMTTLHVFDSGKVEVKMKVIGFDAANGQSLSRAELQARRQMMGLIYYLQTKGYRGQKLATHVLASVSRHIGTREGRRIVGEYLLTEEDVTHACTFPDAVAVGTYHLDYHWPDRVERAGTGITTMVESYHIPLRSLVPKGAKNLLVAGRSAAGDQMAMSSFRIQATCAQMGFAAGTAALVCQRQGRGLQDAPIGSIQQALAAGGQSLDLADYGEYLRHLIHVHEHIFADERPFAQCRASTLVQLKNGRFLAAWFGGTGESNADVGIWGAERSGRRWSAPKLLAKVCNCAHWNPVLHVGADGRVYLFFKVGERIPAWQTWVIESTDAGQGWTEPRQLVLGDEGGRGPVKNKLIVLTDGTWLGGASLETDGWDIFVDRSEDQGKTWMSSDLIERDPVVFFGPGAIQPTLWESAPGQVHMLVHTTCGRVGRSDSQDEGRTWSPLSLTDLPNNNSGLDLARLKDGTLALVCNPVEKGRTLISVLLSSDNGRTWPRRLDLETDAGEYSYPAIIPTEVGLAITYTWKRERVAFWMGSVEQIPDGRG